MWPCSFQTAINCNWWQFGVWDDGDGEASQDVTSTRATWKRRTPGWRAAGRLLMKRWQREGLKRNSEVTQHLNLLFFLNSLSMSLQEMTKIRPPKARSPPLHSMLNWLQGQSSDTKKNCYEILLREQQCSKPNDKPSASSASHTDLILQNKHSPLTSTVQVIESRWDRSPNDY